MMGFGWDTALETVGKKRAKKEFFIEQQNEFINEIYKLLYCDP